VVSVGGSVWVNATTRSAIAAANGGTREGRVLSRKRPSMPSSIKRFCQRQTQTFDVPVSVVPNIDLFEYQVEFHLRPAHEIRPADPGHYSSFSL
jgi:hypothetical protein